MESRTALVLSAGGMFGAYQAGVWKAIADVVQPDLVVGASVGSLNGWAIAGGCSPDELQNRWLGLGAKAQFKLRLPRRLLSGIVDSSGLEQIIADICSGYSPRIRYAAVLTELGRMRPRIFVDGEVTQKHLLASCAVIGIFDQHRIDGTVYTDGGMMSALPIWAAAQLGAQNIIAVHAMPQMPSATIRTLNTMLRKVVRFRPRITESVNVIRIEPEGPLGSALDLLRWDRDKIERWIAQGERDAGRIKHSIEKCFERQ